MSFIVLSRHKIRDICQYFTRSICKNDKKNRNGKLLIKKYGQKFNKNGEFLWTYYTPGLLLSVLIRYSILIQVKIKFVVGLCYESVVPLYWNRSYDLLL